MSECGAHHNRKIKSVGTPEIYFTIPEGKQEPYAQTTQDTLQEKKMPTVQQSAFMVTSMGLGGKR